ncbi:hypothetical protein ACQEU6_46255 [Spirillospora sp. CA-108201]
MNEPDKLIEFFIILTVQGFNGQGLSTRTVTAVMAFAVGVSRAQMYEWMLAQVPPESAGLPVVFFSAEPNRVAGAAALGGGR